MSALNQKGGTHNCELGVPRVEFLDTSAASQCRAATPGIARFRR